MLFTEKENKSDISIEHVNLEDAVPAANTLISLFQQNGLSVLAQPRGGRGSSMSMAPPKVFLCILTPWCFSLN